jgi:hypothetical protein
MPCTALHVPLYLGLLLLPEASVAVQSGIRYTLNLFFIVHVGLHLLLRNHSLNEFGSAFSWALISGAGFCGALDVLVN